MISLDEEAMVCDFAEVYHVLDWRSLPVKTAATLLSGLGPDSRVIRKISGEEIPVKLDTLMLATIADALHILVWQNTEDGIKGKNRPVLIVEKLTGHQEEPLGFDTVEEFRKWHDQMLGGA